MVCKSTPRLADSKETTAHLLLLAPLLFVYYDEPEPGKFEALRELRFSDVRIVDGRPLPHDWLMVPSDKPGHSTRVVLEEAAFDVKLDEEIFTQKYLRQSEAAR